MRITRLHQTEELAPLCAAWTALACGNPFRSWEWLEAWWQCYGGCTRTERDPELFVLAVYDGDCVIAIAPWYLGNSAWSGRTLRFLGGGEACSEYLGLLVAPGRERAVAEAIAEWLSDEAAPLWDLIDLSDMANDDCGVRAFADAMEQRGHMLDRRPGVQCWRVDLPATWDEFVATLSASHRKQLRRMERRLFEVGRARLHTVQSAIELEHAMNSLITLHQSRQTSLQRTGSFASPEFLRFHTQVAQRLLESRRLGLYRLELDGQIVAVEYQLLADDGVFAYQGGIDPSRLHESPGQLITLATLKIAVERGCKFFDFLRGDELYKSHWRARPRGTTRIRVIPNRITSRLRQQIWATARGIQSLVRSGAAMVQPVRAPLVP